MSKSLARALGCETYFIHQYLNRPPGAEPPSPLADVGNAFHAYRAAYADHLAESKQWKDLAWVEEWIASHTIPHEAIDLIRNNAAVWTINPEHIMGSELFLSITRDFQKLELLVGRQPGNLSSHPDAFACGQIDLLEIRGDEATIVDAKTGYSSVSITEEEAAIYSCLVFAHYPQVEVIQFWWDFVRIGAHKRSEYFRSEMPELRAKVESLVARRAELERKARAGETLDANPWAGLCPFCRLVCPIATAIQGRHSVDILPLQNFEDARHLAASVYIAKLFLEKAQPVLKAFLQARGEELPGGRLELGGDYILENSTSTSQELPIRDALHLLGVGMIDLPALNPDDQQLVLDCEPVNSPLFDVPLNSLNLSSSSIKGFAKSKRSKNKISREGLREGLNAIGQPMARSTTLRFRKTNIDPAVAALTEGEHE